MGLCGLSFFQTVTKYTNDFQTELSNTKITLFKHFRNINVIFHCYHILKGKYTTLTNIVTFLCSHESDKNLPVQLFSNV